MSQNIDGQEINPIRTEVFESFKEFRDNILINDDIACDLPALGGPLHLDGLIYRGLPTNSYTLLPTALRSNNSDKLFKDPDDLYNKYDINQVMAEYVLLHRFYQFANNNGLKVMPSPFINHNYQDIDSGFDIGKLRNAFKKWYPEEFRDLAALAQHYGTPTRMLDWTQDSNVALYFASMGAIDRILNLHQSPLEALKLACNSGEKIVIWALNSRQLQFSKYFRKREEQENFSPLKVVIPSYCDNPNLNAQKGILTFWETEIPPLEAKPTDKRPLDELVIEYSKTHPHGAKINMVKYEMPITECTMIYKYLRKLGYTAARLFPGYAGVSKQIEEDRKFEKLHLIIATIKTL